MSDFYSGAVLVLIVWLAVAARRQRGKRVSVGPAAAGTIYELLNNDKRTAIQIIVEERAGERDAEDRDGNLPDLEHPRKASEP